MWAFFRFLRASWIFGWVLFSYLWQLGLRRITRQAAWVERRWDALHERNAKRFYDGCIRLRGVFIKLGQVLSIMGTFLPKPYARELVKLQDSVPPEDYSKVQATINRELGAPPEALFTSFEPTPVAAASLGQVHRATLEDGQVVAVKVLYSRVATIMRVDMKVIRWAMKIYKWFTGFGQVDRVLEQLDDMLQRETDLRHEAACIKRMAANFKDEPKVTFPEVVDRLSAKRVLTMSFMDGVKISNKEALAALELCPNAVATLLVQSFYRSIFHDRFFHADPHPGNFFVQRTPEGQMRLVVLDLGSASEVSDNLADGMVMVLGGFFARDDARVLKGIETMGFYADNGDRELLERTTRRYFEKLLNLDTSDLTKIDADAGIALLDPELKRDELRALMRSINYPPGWFYVERAAIMLFGLSAELAPTLNTVQIGFPYVMKFMASQAMRPKSA